MSASELFLALTDEDGDPLYIKSDVLAIWEKTEKTTIGSMLEPNLRTVKDPKQARGLISQSSGQWAVANSFEEILAEIDRVELVNANANDTRDRD